MARASVSYWRSIGCNCQRYVKKVFYKVEVAHPVNTEAADLYVTVIEDLLIIIRFVNNKKEFADKVLQCVQESVDNMYINANNSSLKFTEPKKEHEAVRKAILNKVPFRTKLRSIGDRSMQDSMRETMIYQASTVVQ